MVLLREGLGSEIPITRILEKPSIFHEPDAVYALVLPATVFSAVMLLGAGPSAARILQGGVMLGVTAVLAWVWFREPRPPSGFLSLS